MMPAKAVAGRPDRRPACRGTHPADGGSVVLRGVPVVAVPDRLAQTREDLEDLVLAVRRD
jgi:hypothetical protein